MVGAEPDLFGDAGELILRCRLGGTFGCIEETARQLAALGDARALNPTMFHLVDMKANSLLVDDHTPLGQGL